MMSENQMNTTLTDYPHIVLEMTHKPDCRFVGSWLMKAAEAEALWSEALRDADFEKRVVDLCAFVVPSLECAAIEILCELKRSDHVLATDLHRVELDGFSFEFGMMVQLGLFAFKGHSYHMSIPETITRQSVQQAALNLLSTARDDDGLKVIQPERLLHTVPKAEAETSRARLIAMRGFNNDTARGQTIQ